MIEDYTIYEINLCVLADFLNKKIRARTRLKFKPYKLLKAVMRWPKCYLLFDRIFHYKII